MRPDPRSYLWDALDAIDRIARYTTAKTREDLRVLVEER